MVSTCTYIVCVHSTGLLHSHEAFWLGMERGKNPWENPRTQNPDYQLGTLTTKPLGALWQTSGRCDDVIHIYRSQPIPTSSLSSKRVSIAETEIL